MVFNALATPIEGNVDSYSNIDVNKRERTHYNDFTLFQNFIKTESRISRCLDTLSHWYKSRIPSFSFITECRAPLCFAIKTIQSYRRSELLINLIGSRHPVPKD